MKKLIEIQNEIINNIKNGDYNNDDTLYIMLKVENNEITETGGIYLDECIADYNSIKRINSYTTYIATNNNNLDISITQLLHNFNEKLEEQKEMEEYYS